MSEENKNDQPNTPKDSEEKMTGGAVVYQIGIGLTMLYLYAEDPLTSKYGGWHLVSNFVIDMLFSLLWPLYWVLLHWVL